MNEMITIRLDQYNRLLYAYRKLSRLEAAGVDNWSGYDYAFEDDDLDDVDGEGKP